MAKPRRVGKYRFIAEIGHGGMAEVFLGVMEGPARFSKLVAVKLLRDQFAEQPEGREMFLNEARLAARLSHPNVVNVLEVGEDDGRLFIAMEYLRGQPLSRLLSRLRQGSDTTVPDALLLRILSEALSGLHHAHECSDFDGTPLQLVHRDVTPHNIFVTYDGMVKVLDFGIAKAMSMSGHTRAGTIKGKAAFMAPEQLLADVPIDRRVDIYSVGCCLWEVIAKRRPFAGLPDVAVMTRVASEGMPSVREAVPDVPDELERICSKAVAYRTDERYLDANDFQNELDAYLASLGAQTGRKEIGAVLNTIFADEQERTKEVIEANLATASFANTDELPISSLAATNTGSGSWSKSSSNPHESVSSVNGSVALTLAEAKRTSGLRTKLVVAGVAGLLGLGVAAVFLSRSASSGVDGALPAETARSPVKIKIAVEPATARIFLDGNPLPTNPAEFSLPPDEETHTLRAEASGYLPRTKPISFNVDQEVVLELDRQPAPEPPEPSATASEAVPPPAVQGGRRWSGVSKPAPSPSPTPTETEPAPPPATTPAPPATPTGKKKRQLDDDNPFASE